MKNTNFFRVALPTKWLIVAIVFINHSPIYSQTYKFSYFDETYKNLVNATKVSPDNRWNDIYIPKINIGFDFKINDQYYNILDVDARGSFSFNYQSLDTFAVISAYDIQLNDKAKIMGTTESQSTLSYKLLGSPGQRIFIFQWRNLIYDANDASQLDSVNFQLWLYEGTNNFKALYGPSFLLNGLKYMDENPPSIGCFSTIKPPIFDDHYIIDSLTTPTLVYREAYYKKMPLANKAFLFEYIKPTGISSNVIISKDQKFLISNNKIKLDPNFQHAYFEIINMNGQRVFSKTITNENEIDLNQIHFSNGIYVFKLSNADGQRLIEKFAIF